MTWFPEPDPWQKANAMADLYDRWMAVIDAQREAERIAYCERHSLDPKTWDGCHACEGTGILRDSGYFCYCKRGKDLQDEHERRAEQEFQERMNRRRADTGAA